MFLEEHSAVNAIIWIAQLFYWINLQTSV